MKTRLDMDEVVRLEMIGSANVHPYGSNKGRYR